MRAGGFSFKIWKEKDMRAQFFLRIDVFWRNMGMRAGCFLENGRFFDKIGVREQWFFRAKSEKKGDPIDFFGP